MSFLDNLVNDLLDAVHDHQVTAEGADPNGNPPELVSIDAPTHDQHRTVYPIVVRDPDTDETDSLQVVVDLNFGYAYVSNRYCRVSDFLHLETKTKIAKSR